MRQEAATTGMLNMSGMKGRLDGLFIRIVFTSRAEVCLLAGCLTSQQQASVSQGRICSKLSALFHWLKPLVDKGAEESGEPGGNA